MSRNEDKPADAQGSVEQNPPEVAGHAAGPGPEGTAKEERQGEKAAEAAREAQQRDAAPPPKEDPPEVAGHAAGPGPVEAREAKQGEKQAKAAAEHPKAQQDMPDEDEEDDRPRRRRRQDRPQALPVGEEVWFLMRSDPPEWVPAEVVDSEPWEGGAKLGMPIRQGAVHLAVEVDQERHFANVDTVLRMNVVEGTEPGQYSKRRPRGATAAYERAVLEKSIREDIGRGMAIDADRGSGRVPTPA